MRCPSCNSLDTQVKDSRPTEDSAVIRRRRVCIACNFRFTTFERVQLRELTVIKRNGRRVPFDRDKLVRSLQISLRKRPVDPETPFVTSGLRLGTPAATTRGFGVAEFKQVGMLISEVLNAIAQSQDGKAPLVEAAIKERVKALTDRFPIYQ